MHEARDQPLQQLLLPEDDDRFATKPTRDVVRAVGGLAHADQPRQEQRAAGEEAAGHRDGGGEEEAAGEAVYPAFAFLISAEIAGTTWWRSPITA